MKGEVEFLGNKAYRGRGWRIILVLFLFFFCCYDWTIYKQKNFIWFIVLESEKSNSLAQASSEDLLAMSQRKASHSQRVSRYAQVSLMMPLIPPQGPIP